MRKIILLIVIVCWLLGLFIHMLSVFGYELYSTLPYEWILHIGILLVLIPTIFFFINDKERQLYQQFAISTSFKRLSNSVIVFKSKPFWLRWVVIGCFFYGIFNFAIFLPDYEVSKDKNGIHYLHNHSTVIGTLTEQEYHQYRVDELRGISGLWLLFYGIEAVILFPPKIKGIRIKKNYF